MAVPDVAALPADVGDRGEVRDRQGLEPVLGRAAEVARTHGAGFQGLRTIEKTMTQMTPMRGTSAITSPPEAHQSEPRSGWS